MIERLRMAHGEPMAYLCNYLPAGLLDLRHRPAGGHRPVPADARRRDHPAQRPPVRRRAGGDRRRRPSRSPRRPGAPLLTMQRTTFDDTGRAVEFGAHTYRASRYSFEFQLLVRPWAAVVPAAVCRLPGACPRRRDVLTQPLTARGRGRTTPPAATDGGRRYRCPAQPVGEVRYPVHGSGARTGYWAADPYRARQTEEEGRGLVARFRSWVSSALAAALGLSLAGCSSPGGKRAEDGRNAAAAGRQRSTPPLDDRDGHPLRRGRHLLGHRPERRQAGGQKDNVKFLYSARRRGPAAGPARADAAIDKKVDGLIVTLAKPDAMKASSRRPTKAGIPVDHDQLRRRAVQGVRRAHPHRPGRVIAGEAVGEELNKRGRRRPCASSTSRATSLSKSAARVRRRRSRAAWQNLNVDGTNMPDVQASIEAKLQADTDIDTVVTLGAPFADASVKAKERPAARPRSTPSTSTPRWSGLKAGSRLRRRPAALPPGLRGRGPPLAQQVQRR